MVCDNNERNQLIDIDNQYSLVKQFKTISVVTALFWYGAPFAVRFVTNVCGCITRYIIDISSLLKQVIRNTLDSVKDVMLDEHQVMKVRIQYLMFILVNWNAISEILGSTHFDSKKKEIEKRDRVKEVFQEGKLVQVAYEAFGTWRLFRPSELFALGAFARAIQLCTPFQYSFDPSVGVAALVNFGSINIMRRAKWVAYFVIGWTTTPRLWRYCGATWNGHESTEESLVESKFELDYLNEKNTNNFSVSVNNSTTNVTHAKQNKEDHSN